MGYTEVENGYTDMSYAEALKNGYKKGDVAWSRGYVSRTTDTDDLIVRVAGGKRKGQLFVDLPSWSSTTYHVRQYLVEKA